MHEQVSFNEKVKALCKIVFNKFYSASGNFTRENSTETRYREEIITYNMQEKVSSNKKFKVLFKRIFHWFHSANWFFLGRTRQSLVIVNSIHHNIKVSSKKR